MAEESTTHGASTVLAPNIINEFHYLEPLRDVSTVLANFAPGHSAGSGGTTPLATLDLERRYLVQQGIISAQRQIINDKNQEILRLQHLVASLSRESDEDLEDFDYSSMEATARVQVPTGVNWRAVPRTTTYSELFDARDGLGAEEG